MDTIEFRVPVPVSVRSGTKNKDKPDLNPSFVVNRQVLSDWVRVLSQKIDSGTRAFWHYPVMDPQKDARDIKAAKFSETPRLWTAPESTQNQTYSKVKISGSFFCDANDYHYRLLAATLAERDAQRATIENINRVHNAQFRRLAGRDNDSHATLRPSAVETMVSRCPN
jgi:hypothetical protein